MFIGHFGLALAAKKIDPKVNLGWLFTGAQFIDLLWPMFVLLKLENVSPLSERMGVNSLNFESYPLSHSLAGVLVWAIALGVLVFVLKHSRSMALLISCLVLSHWFLDLIVHEPDLPLYNDQSTKFGFMIWRSVPLTLLLEFGIFLAGAYLYARTKNLNTRSKKISFYSLLAVLIAVYLPSVFGPLPPPGTPAAAIAGPALAMWLFVFWGYRLDK